MIVSLVVAVAENQVIGKDGKLPWNLPNDLKHFRELTTGKPVIMGRKTFVSIGKPLPNRENIVITRQPHLHLSGCIIVHSLKEALRYAEKQIGAKEAFIIGGGEIFTEALSLADRVYLTRVHGTFEGDAYFPALDPDEWEAVDKDEHEEDQQHMHAYTFLLYERKK
jgi:dihydrofolate reductase